MQRISFDDRGLQNWISSRERDGYEDGVARAETMLHQGTGPGNDFLGWLQLPEKVTSSELDYIQSLADKIRSDSDVLICIGIGGSYLGARAAIEFCSSTFEDCRAPRIIFAGHQVNSDYMHDIIQLIENKNVTINIISKSGTTTEPGIAFRVLKAWMEKKYGKKGAAARIIATTDPDKGALRTMATDEGYATLPIPGDVGGRFSVLTAVGLLPIAAAGLNIKQLVSGAREAMTFCSATTQADNLAARYAVGRNILLRRGKFIEVLAGFQPQLHFISEWWKQLFGESEGKNQTGIFPASVDYTTDLHSMGQWMQEGMRTVFETFMVIRQTRQTLTIPSFDDNLDGLNFLAGKSFEEINQAAFQGTVLAHQDGQVPTSVITLADRSEETLGQLFYFFQKATAISGYLLRVNPFDQPGVEAYKNNMFALMNKPGYEAQGENLRSMISRLGL